MRDSIKKWANQEKQRVRREAMQGWQAMKGAAALSGDAVTTTATTAKSAFVAVEEEDESYIEEVEEEDSDQADDDGTGLDCASVEQVGGVLTVPAHQKGA